MLGQETIQTEFSLNRYGEKYLYDINKISFDRYDSISVFNAHFNNELWENNTFNVIIGTDSGLLVDYVIKNKPDDDSVFLFIELPEIFHKILENVDIDNCKNIVVTTHDKLEKLVQEYQAPQFIFKDKLRFYESLGARSDIYHSLKFSVHHDLETISFGNRVSLGSENFIIKQLENLCENIVPAGGLEDKFFDKTCIILAGGPSLDLCLDWVIANKDKFIIIAASRISRRLQQVNLVPDIVVCVDPFEESFDVSKEMLNFPESVVFANCYHVVPNLLSQWHGPKMYLGAKYPWTTKNNKDNFGSSGPTVTNFACLLALNMGFSRVLLAGVDLCFSKEGYTHAKGSIESGHGPLLTAEGLWIETNTGEMAETQIQLVTAKETMEELFDNRSHKNHEIINLSLYGAKIQGTDYRDFNDIDFDADIDEAKKQIRHYAANLEKQDLKVSYNQVLSEVNKVEKDLCEVMTLATKAIEVNELLYVDEQSSTDEKYLHKIGRIQSKLDKKYSYLSKLLKVYGLGYFVSFMDPGSVDEWEKDKLRESGKLYYRAYFNSAKGLLYLVRKAKNRTESRLEELKKNPDFDSIFAQWEQDSQFGRAVIWKDNQSLDNISEQVKHQFEKHIEQFYLELNEQDTLQSQIVSKLASIDNIDSRVMQLFAKKNIEALKKISLGLSLQSSQDANCQSMTSLVDGLVLMLEGDKVNALAMLQKTSSEKHRVHALNQIIALSLSLNELTSAMDSLAELSEFSPRYLPKLAHLQFLTQDNLAAVDSYNTYLQLFPEDVHAWLELAKIFIALGVCDAAEVAYTEVLRLDPDNVVASQQLELISQSV
ncbi:DUF115 domain-containing protein [Shewanella eurypsychrophilus]|uniref:DUF115 domain-containing protein n=1 Tax=Shewanella eurypsychrophilus TaxID=2593656 RepID=A0ABX6V7Z3_9GAMM|nr:MULTISPECIES: 6-hydroxymethylpterin diphosphokinase MptE-like protein [Shewanella]QFU23534.1 DUF115 domain-containing protein [Shewanella sp. YLB-09]QPG58760.1 DUF115 domain-containing protein [Shewanella eurypsychrophilus]